MAESSRREVRAGVSKMLEQSEMDLENLRIGKQRLVSKKKRMSTWAIWVFTFFFTWWLEEWTYIYIYKTGHFSCSFHIQDIATFTLCEWTYLVSFWVLVLIMHAGMIELLESSVKFDQTLPGVFGVAWVVSFPEVSWRKPSWRIANTARRAHNQPWNREMTSLSR